MQMYMSAFPDLHFEIDQIFGDGDFVTTRWTATGTHRGELIALSRPGSLRGGDVWSR